MMRIVVVQCGSDDSAYSDVADDAYCGNNDDDANDDSCGEKGDNAYRLSVSHSLYHSIVRTL